jgi:aspartyl/asparaginyl beta-hydroxylase (cupin superfamily)
MANKTLEPWFSDTRRPFCGDEPYYYNTAQFPWVAKVEARWEEIRDELLQNLEEDERILKPYVDKKMATKADHWRTFSLVFWRNRSEENCRRFPRTCSIVKDIPGLMAVSFNLLDANTTIKPHVGDTNAIIRCHMGLVIPASAPQCGFRVGDETRSWEQGKFLMFCDAHRHTAWNNTDKRRYILVVDVIRPEFASSAAAVSTRVLKNIWTTAQRKRSWWRRKVGQVALAVLPPIYRLFSRR